MNASFTNKKSIKNNFAAGKLNANANTMALCHLGKGEMFNKMFSFHLFVLDGAAWKKVPFHRKADVSLIEIIGSYIANSD